MGAEAIGGKSMERVLCPVCEKGEIVFGKKAKKGVCSNCESTLVAQGGAKDVLKHYAAPEILDICQGASVV